MNNILFNYFFSFSVYPSVAWFFVFVSNILIYLFILFAIFYPLYKKRDYIYAIFVGGTGAFTYVVSSIVKHIFKIPRPFITNHITPLVLESSYSFPSSHVTVITALTVIVWKMNRKWGVVFAIFIVLVALSRMILGVHYPVDVLGGIVLGIFVGLFTLWFYKRTNKLAFLRKII